MLDELVTELSEVDGEHGILIIRGNRIESLAGVSSFEAVTSLLWGAPTDPGPARVAAFQQLADLWRHAAGRDLTDAVRWGLAALRPEPDVAPHLLLLGAFPVLVAGLIRQSRGQRPVAPEAGASHAADFLRMLTDAPADTARVRALDTYWTTVAEHGMNASTFTARVIASTAAGTQGAVIGALCALQGPLHGGAPGPVLDMLDAIGTPDRAPAWIEQRLQAGHRLMGFGHRIYRVRDPRAEVLRTAVAALRGEAPGARLQLAAAVERAALEALARHKPDRPLATNVEYYTALLLEAVGLPREAFTAAFACARVAGWCAHIFEQSRSGRLIRPSSRYVGPPATIGSAR